LDFEDYATYETALKQVDYVFLVTAYTVDMLAHSKNLIDVAKKEGVKHIVHVGTFHQPGRPAAILVGHFIWHQYIESYLEHSGIGYTLLHPNGFNQNMHWFVKDGKVRIPQGTHAMGYIDAQDIADVAAEAIRFPEKHNGKRYWLSTEALTGPQIAQIYTEETGKQFTYDPLNDEEMKQLMLGTASKFEVAYARCGVGFFQKLIAGKLPDIADVFPDVVPNVLGRQPHTLRDFVRKNKASFL